MAKPALGSFLLVRLNVGNLKSLTCFHNVSQETKVYPLILAMLDNWRSERRFRAWKAATNLLQPFENALLMAADRPLRSSSDAV